MRTNKTRQFVVTLEGTLTRLSSKGVRKVKLAIGDSVNNNRVLTVNQLIRFLNSSKNSDLRKLGVQLNVVYKQVKPYIAADRTFTSRTDAIDINELIRTVNFLSFTNSAIVKSLGQYLSAGI